MSWTIAAVSFPDACVESLLSAKSVPVFHDDLWHITSQVLINQFVQKQFGLADKFGELAGGGIFCQGPRAVFEQFRITFVHQQSLSHFTHKLFQRVSQQDVAKHLFGTYPMLKQFIQMIET